MPHIDTYQQNLYLNYPLTTLTGSSSNFVKSKTFGDTKLVIWCYLSIKGINFLNIQHQHCGILVWCLRSFHIRMTWFLSSVKQKRGDDKRGNKRVDSEWCLYLCECASKPIWGMSAYGLARLEIDFRKADHSRLLVGESSCIPIAFVP